KQWLSSYSTSSGGRSTDGPPSILALRECTAQDHFAKRHRRTVWLASQERACRPSGEMATPRTRVACPSKQCNSRPVVSSHRRTALSPQPAETARLPSDVTATSRTPPSCFIVRSSLPVSISHKRNVPSMLADKRERPSGKNATAVTSPVWPLNERTSLPV